MHDMDSETASNQKPLSPPDDMAEVRKVETQYPSFGKLCLVMCSLYISMFLVALDKTIISTAIPRITDEFSSLSDIGWYGSAYTLTLCSFQLFYGRIYNFYNPKTIFLICILIFEIGSAICGSAPSSTAFIIGRAIAGAGSAGVSSGVIVIVVHTVPLEKRPLFQGMIGAVFGVACVAGPLLGGVFTEQVSWRWCFYINLPIGAVSIAILVLILDLPPHEEWVPFKKQWQQLDPIGTVLFLPSIVCLLLALQWGGTTYAWSSARIIALLVLFPILLIAFIGVQIWKQDDATIPPRIITQRSVASGTVFTFLSSASMLIVEYYIPLWFQAIKGRSPMDSGIDLIPMILSLVIASILTGAFVQKVGYYFPPMIAASVFMSVGAGLISTWETNTGHSKWIGYQVIYGLGIGMGIQQPSMAAQVVLDKKDVSIGIALMFFFQNFGGSIFLSVAQNVFTDALINNLRGVAGLDAQIIVNTGATNLRKVVSPNLLHTVLVAYNGAVRSAFHVGLGIACAMIFGALCIEWRSVKKAKKGPTQAEKIKEEKEVEEV